MVIELETPQCVKAFDFMLLNNLVALFCALFANFSKPEVGQPRMLIKLEIVKGY